jgi:DNA (cytosine-5)-methyltransferase 1
MPRTAAKPEVTPRETLRSEDKSFLEFFAGIGLVREGLCDSGWDCIYANDNDPKKREMYAGRFGEDVHFQLGDICDTQQVAAHLPAGAGLATASFPCTDLSLAGNWRGLAGKHSSAFFGFADVLDALGDDRPPLVMLENVPGLITSHDGRDFAQVAATLAELGYWLDAFVIDAKYFVPQSRPRVFIVGVHEAADAPLMIRAGEQFLGDPWRLRVESTPALRPQRLVQAMTSIDLATGWFTLALDPPRTQRDELSSVIDLDDAQEWWDEAQVDKHWGMMSDLHQDLVGELRADGGTHVGTIYRRKRGGTTRAEVRFDGVAGCLRTPRGGSARQIVIVIERGELRIRWMSPREYARLQGAGDFPLVERKNQNLFGFGDAVCVPVIRWIDANVLTPLFDTLRTPR